VRRAVQTSSPSRMKGPSVFCASLWLMCASVHGAFVMPKGFEGLWSGVPEYNVLGPWDSNITFSIAKAANGDYLMQDILAYDTAILPAWGWQRFYVEGNSTEEGLLWYCSNTELWGNNELAGARPGKDAFSLQSVTASSVTWCLASSWDFQYTTVPFPIKAQGNGDCTGCSCANWTMSLSSQDTLDIDFRIAGAPSHTHAAHLVVSLSRRGAALPVKENMPAHGAAFQCNFTAPLPDFPHAKDQPVVNSGCPFKRNRVLQKQLNTPKQLPLVLATPPQPSTSAGEYDHCYVLNRKNNFRLSWSLDRNKQTLRVKMSTKTSSEGYVALGFRPLSRLSIPNGLNEFPKGFPEELKTQIGLGTKFGMVGADIVVGSAAGVKTMYAALYTGPPEAADYLKLSDASASYDSAKGEMSATFTRPLVGGYLMGKYPELMSGFAAAGINGTIDNEKTSDNIWAVGEMSSGSPGYHFSNRGLSGFSWADPSQHDWYNRC